MKLIPLLATPPTVTTTLPVVAPARHGHRDARRAPARRARRRPVELDRACPLRRSKIRPADHTAVPTVPDAGLRLLIAGAAEVTVKLIPLLATPPTVTTTLPVVAPAGTGTAMLVALQLVGLAAVPLNVTVLLPCVAPKFVPLIAHRRPHRPRYRAQAADRWRCRVTVKLIPLLATPPTVTTTLPVVAPARHRHRRCSSRSTRRARRRPVELDCAGPLRRSKVRPADRTAVPTVPDVGIRLVIAGAAEVTVKLIPLLATPPTVTTTFPVVAPARHRHRDARRAPARRRRRRPVERHRARPLRRSEVRPADRHRRPHLPLVGDQAA